MIRKHKKNTREAKFWERLGDTDVTNWDIEKIYKSEGYERCCCGQPIKIVYVISHAQVNEIKTVGNCCAKRLGLKLCWQTKADYLANAMLFAKQDWERDMIKQLQNKLPMWGSGLRISYKQIVQLERMTGHKWRGAIW